MTEKKRWYYILFVVPKKNLGATSVQATSIEDALAEATRRGLNPGGEALVIEVPTYMANDPDIVGCRNRLRLPEEAYAAGCKSWSTMTREERETLSANLSGITNARIDWRGRH